MLVRSSLAVALVSLATATVAHAQTPPPATPPAAPGMPAQPSLPGQPAQPQMPAPPALPTMPATPTTPTTPPVAMPPPTTAMQPNMLPGQVIPPPEAPEDPDKKKEPKRGDFDAGAQARFPSGPDSMGKYATWNWVAADIKARYFLLSSVTANFYMPLALIKPDAWMDGLGNVHKDPRMFGGAVVRLEAKLPKFAMPFLKQDTDLGLSLQVGSQRDGAILLSEKDFPHYNGNFHPTFDGGLIVKLKLSNLLDFSLLPAWEYQKGGYVGGGSITAIQVPMNLIVKLGDVIKLGLDLSIYTGDGYSLRPSHDGRLGTGLGLDVKIGPILAHAGAGFASLLPATSGPYPTIGDSFYIDLNAKYVK